MDISVGTAEEGEGFVFGKGRQDGGEGEEGSSLHILVGANRRLKFSRAILVT